MGDLQCAATLIVARHGEATYDERAVAQGDGGRLTQLGRQQAVYLATTLADKRIAGIWCSDRSHALETAEIVSARLGELPIIVRVGLRATTAGESDEAVVARVSRELEAAADEFRGETILLVCHSGEIGLTLPALASNVSGDFASGRPVGNGAACEVVVDGDGWLLLTWNGQPL